MQFQGSKTSSGLFQDFMGGYIKYYDFLQLLKDSKDSIVAVTIDNQSG